MGPDAKKEGVASSYPVSAAERGVSVEIRGKNLTPEEASKFNQPITATELMQRLLNGTPGEVLINFKHLGIDENRVIDFVKDKDKKPSEII